MATNDETKIRVAILDDYQRVAFTAADWTLLKDRISVDQYSDTLLAEDDLVKRLHPYTIVCAMRERTKFTAALFDRLPNLRFIATTGPGNRGIDVAYAKSKGIVVSGTGGKGNSTLEHIWALILGTARYIPQEDANTKAAKEQWQTYIPIGLGGKTLGLVGAGRLGASTAKIAKAFNMKVIAWSPHLTPERAAAAGVEFCESKATLFASSDVVSIQMVLSPETHHLITHEDLTLMKKTAIFINTSRGPLVDEDALVRVLNERRIASAGLDVFDIEPLPLDHPLRKLDNVTLSPHLGYVSDDNYEVFWGQTVENILAFLDGEPKRVMS